MQYTELKTGKVSLLLNLKLKNLFLHLMKREIIKYKCSCRTKKQKGLIISTLRNSPFAKENKENLRVLEKSVF